MERQCCGKLLIGCLLVCGGAVLAGPPTESPTPLSAAPVGLRKELTGGEALRRLQALREARFQRATPSPVPTPASAAVTTSMPTIASIPAAPVVPVAPMANTEGRMRVAILPIQAASGNSPFDSGTFDAGKAITDRLLARFQGSDRFACFDRSHLDVVLREQDLGRSGRVTPETAAEIGRLTGVQYLLTGTVSEFAMVKGRTGEISVPTPFGSVKAGGRGKRVRTAVDLKMIEVATGRIVAAVSGRDEISAGDAAFGATVNGVDVNYGSEEFVNSALGKSMDRIAQTLLRQLEASPVTPPLAPPELACQVMGNVNGQIVLNAGRKHGMQLGMMFTISHAVEMIDPADGLPKRVNLPRGEIKIIAVDEETSVGEALAADRNVVPGDQARRK